MEYKADSHLSCDVEEDELSSGRSSPGTIRQTTSQSSTQTDDCKETVMTMRVKVENDNTPEQTINQTTPTPINQMVLNQLTPLKIARRIVEQTVRTKASDVRKNLESFRTRTIHITQAHQTVIADSIKKNLHSY